MLPEDKGWERAIASHLVGLCLKQGAPVACAAVPSEPVEFGKGEGTCTWEQLLLKIFEVAVYGSDMQHV